MLVYTCLLAVLERGSWEIVGDRGSVEDVQLVIPSDPATAGESRDLTLGQLVCTRSAATVRFLHSGPLSRAFGRNDNLQTSTNHLSSRGIPATAGRVEGI